MSPADPPFDEGPAGGWAGGDLSWLLGSQSAGRRAAEELAAALATDGSPEANVPPADRAAFAELAGIAQLAAEAATGLPITAGGGTIEIAVVNRRGWAHHTLGDWRPHFGHLREGLAPEDDEPATSPVEDPEAMLNRLMKPMAPLLTDLTAGSLTGRMARVALGSYDLPLPRVRSDRLLLVEPNITSFAQAWSLPRDDTCLWVCVHSLISNAAVNVPAVHGRLTELLQRHAHNFEIDPSGIVESLQERIGEPESGLADADISSLLSSPEVLLGTGRSEDGDETARQLEEFLSVLTGYIEATTERACAQLLGSRNPVREVFRRRRLTPPGETRRPARLFGVEVSPEASGRGGRFVEGAIERAGTAGIAKLWQTAENWPTPNEVSAPGLWLARLEIYEDARGPDAGGCDLSPGDR